MDNVVLSTKFFNDLYFDLDKSFTDDDVRYIYIYGGSSSGKSHTIAQRIIIFAMENANNNSIVFKKFLAGSKNTIFATFVKALVSLKLKQYFTIQEYLIKCNLTGSYISFGGLDDVDKVKGLEGYKKVYIDELDQISYATFEDIETRLRGQTGQQIISSFNPVSEFSFIKKEIFDKEIFINHEVKGGDLKQVNKENDIVVIRTNYLFNRWVKDDKHVVKRFERLKISNYNKYRVYCLGEWGHLRTGGEFLKQFDTSKHVGKVPYNASEPLHICFDENVLPYLTCLVFQFYNNTVYQIDEITLSDPRNTLKDTCDEFLLRYGSNRQGLFIYGDATSRKRDTKLERGQNFFKLIYKYLVVQKPIFRVPQSNPSVVMSRNFTNDFLAGYIDNLRILIDDKCINSINDYQYCTEDENGKVNKKVIRDKATGQSFQEYGHCVDNIRYLLTALFLEKYKKFKGV